MSGRSNWEAKTSVLDRLDPSRKAEALARAKARAGRETNEAIKVSVETPQKAKREPVLPGLNPMGVRASARKYKVDSAVD